MKKLLGKIFFIGLLVGIAFTIYSYHGGIEPKVLKDKYAYPESEFIDVEGLQVHTRVTGSGEPILLMHGVASSLHTWEAWQQELSKEYKVISIDLPSFGLTGPFKREDVNLDDYVKVIEGVMKHYGADQFYIAGNSFGGFLAWYYASLHPEQVKKIALLSAAGLQPKGKIAGKMISFKLMGMPLIKYTTYYLTPKFIMDYSLNIAYGKDFKITDDLANRYYELLLGKGNREGFSKIMSNTDQMPRDSAIVYLKRLKTPTLIQCGSKDLVVQPEYSREMDSLIPNSQLKFYEGVGHVPQEEAVTETLKDFKAFIKDSIE